MRRRGRPRLEGYHQQPGRKWLGLSVLCTEARDACRVPGRRVASCRSALASDKEWQATQARRSEREIRALCLVDLPKRTRLEQDDSRRRSVAGMSRMPRRLRRCRVQTPAVLRCCARITCGAVVVGELV